MPIGKSTSYSCSKILGRNPSEVWELRGGGALASLDTQNTPDKVQKIVAILKGGFVP